MPTTKLDRQLGVAARLPLALALLLPLVVAVALWLANRHDERVAWVRHTLVVENALSDLRNTLLSLQVGQRGYLLTGDDRYLAAYDQIKASLPAQFDKLSDLTLDNPEQQQRLGQVRSLAGEKLAELETVVARYRGGDIDGALAMVGSFEALSRLEGVRLLIQEMRDAEENLLSGRSRSAAVANAGVLIAIGAAALLVLLSTALWVRNTRAAARALRVAYGELAVMNDRLEHTVAERTRELRDSHEHLRLIMESAIDYAIITTDLNGRISAWSAGAEQILGYGRDEAVGQGIAMIFTPEDRRAGVPEREMGQALSRDSASDDRWHLTKAGTTFWASGRMMPLRDDAGHTVGFLKILRDRTAAREAEERLRLFAQTLEEHVAQRTEELAAANRNLVAEMANREAAESQVRQMQKMEAMGQLTGGIAHDFNNMLAIIIGSLNLAQRRRAKGDGDIDRFLDAALDGAGRAATLTSRLLAFSRQQPLAPEPIDANRLVAGMSELLRRTLGEAIRIETVLAGGLWTTHADASQLESAVLNLAVNARDAMPEGGRLTIETANAHLDEIYAGRNHDVPPGQYVLIALTDTGSGMLPEVAARAFDPFFTTKPVGRGTGLGLSQVYGFVKQSGGHVKIYSEPGEGTVVKIYLPRFFGTEEMAQDKPGRSLPTPHGDPREIILVVEDEERVRQFAIDALRELGYTVLHADSAATALRALDGNPDVALLLTDIVMPDMNGRKLADEAMRRRPALKVLYMTGFTRNAVVHNGMLDPGVNFLAKPFTIDQLAIKVRDVLGRFPGGAT